MLTISRTTRVFLATESTDMRKGFDGLSALVEHVIREDPFSGHLFVFRNQRRDRLKLLWWDRDGWALFDKKLESHCPRSFLFTENAGDANTGNVRPAAVGGMDSSSTRIGPRRRPMSREVIAVAPPRAQFPANRSASTSCGVC